MSGDTVCDLEALVFCPFCGNKTTKIEVNWAVYSDKDGQESTIPDSTHTIFKYIQFRIECESHNQDSQGPNGEFCPAMMEGGAYFLNVYPNDKYSCYAQYF